MMLDLPKMDKVEDVRKSTRWNDTLSITDQSSKSKRVIKTHHNFASMEAQYCPYVLDSGHELIGYN